VMPRWRVEWEFLLPCVWKLRLGIRAYLHALVIVLGLMTLLRVQHSE
jgi:hypothetical protein